MKKIIIVTMAICFLNSGFAQLQPVLKNRRGIAILPQAGDIAVGFGANPFLTYFGNMFNGNAANNSPGTTFATPNQSLFFKYMKSNDVAYRVTFRLGLNSNSYTSNVQDLAPGAISGSYVRDVQKTRNNAVGLSFGIEKRKGSTRLQGYYGGEVFLNFNSGTDSKFTYGNKIEYDSTIKVRTTIDNSSSSISVGIRGFVGVEYFVAPRISIGGEFGYGPAFMFKGANEKTSETYDKSTDTHGTVKISTSPRSSGFSLDTDNYNGIIKLLFYF